MSLIPRITRNTLQIFDSTNGSIKRTMNLPSNADFSGPIVTGDLVTVSIQYKSGKNKSRTYNIKTGALVREIDM